ncbi:MAG: radical SAM protein [Deltaproteobacteria bacterium]|nr:radical SAM protein [Deltaproteobacteria bacterium]
MDGGRGGRDRIFLSSTTGMCRACGAVVDARYVSERGRVYLEHSCPEHGVFATLVAESLPWYLDALKSPVAARPPRQVVERTGECPSSCGPCEFHAQHCCLPVIPITNACDLACPICFGYTRPDDNFHMSPEEFGRQLDFLVGATGGVDLINVTGGEPTLHPRLTDLLVLAKRPEIGRITVNTNGLTLARDEDMVRRLADLGVYVILSYDTVRPEASIRIRGRDITAEKRRALENLARFDVQTTLLMVLAGKVNEQDVGPLLDLTIETPNVRSLTIQNMTYTGQRGSSFSPREPLPVDSVERLIEEASRGRILRSDFVPLPTAHPLCYGVVYLMVGAEGRVRSFSRILGRETLARHLADGYLLHPTQALEADLLRAIDRLWAEGEDPVALRTARDVIGRIFPSGRNLSVYERQRRGEQAVKTIYVHAHMDEDTWEVGRAMRCPDNVPVNAERLVCACNYNLFHRKGDSRFWGAS